MKRRILCISLGLLCVHAVAAASPILAIDAPAFYAPGGTFAVTVALTGAEDLSLYNIELVLSSPGGIEGVDYLFTSAAEPETRYVFGGLVSDGFAFSILGDSKHRITLSDLLTSGSVTTAAGVNDLVGEVAVSTTAGMTEGLTISVVAESLELDRPAGGTIDGFDALAADLPISTIPVPEPATAILIIPFATFLFRRSRRTA